MLTILGMVVGPVLLSVVTLVLYATIMPESFQDAQFAMYSAVTLPFGALLGGLAGRSVALHRLRRRREGGRLAFWGGVTVALIALLAWWPWPEFYWIEWIMTLSGAACLSIFGAWRWSVATQEEQWKRFRDPLSKF